jgi:hypothetical protein
VWHCFPYFQKRFLANQLGFKLSSEHPAETLKSFDAPFVDFVAKTVHLMEALAGKTWMLNSSSAFTTPYEAQGCTPF